MLGFLTTEPTRPFQTHFSRPEADSLIHYLNRLGANLKIPPERSTVNWTRVQAARAPDEVRSEGCSKIFHFYV